MRALLSQGLSELGLDVSRAETLERFSSLLLEKNNVMNLTAITEPDAVAQLHLLDSAALLPFVDLTGKTVIDVGTGAGFPGMPLRILKDDFDLTLLDSLGKRVNWLSEVCDELQLKRVACVHARAEEFAMQHREQFDIATSRAVAQLSILSELCLPLIKVGGQFIAMKSVDTEDEIAAAKSAIKTLGGHIVKVEDYNDKAKNNQQLEITAKVTSVAEAKTKAEKYLRLHNKYAKTATFTLPGNPDIVAGVTAKLTGWGAWDGKYIVEQAAHSVGSSGYTTQVKLRKTLEGY